MRIFSIFAATLLGLVVMGSGASAASTPSFDCTKATTVVEKAICANPKLAQSDAQMAAQYSAILNSATPQERLLVRKAQDGWLKDLSECNREVVLSLYSCIDARFYFYFKGVIPALEAIAKPAFRARKYPFQPRMLVNNQASLCPGFLDGVKKSFFGIEVPVSSSWRHSVPVPLGEWFSWENAESNNIPGERLFYTAKKVDLDGNHKQAYIILVTGPMLSSFNWFKLFVDAPGKEIDPAAEVYSAHRSDLGLPDSWKPIALFGGSQDAQLYDPPEILEFDHRYYLMSDSHAPQYAAGFAHDPVLNLFRIHGDGTTELTCSVSAWPGVDGFPMNWATTAPADKIAAPSGLRTLFDTLREIQGQDVSNGYTHVLSWMIDRSAVAQYLVVARPWTIVRNADSGDQDPRVTQADLMAWGLRSLSNFRQIRALHAKLQDATADLAAFYTAQYGVVTTEARRAAQAALAYAIDDSFAFGGPHNAVGSDDPLDEDGLRASLAQEMKNASVDGGSGQTLIKALLLGMPTDTVKALLDQGAEIDDAPDPNPWELTEPTLFAALEHPALLQLLLDHGAKSDVSNGFGKTGLMYAAQYDLLESVRLLLKSGTSVNRQTQAPEFAYNFYFIRHDHRTALMYAAANASLPVIKALLDAGADRTLQDSTNLTALDYLLGHGPVPANPKLQGEELEQAKMLLAP